MTSTASGRPSSMSQDYNRIHHVTFKAVVCVFSTTAILATIGRLTLRYRYHRRLFMDDFVLLFGCSSLIAAFTLTNIMLEGVRSNMIPVLSAPSGLQLHETVSPDFKEHILKYQPLSFIANVLCWVTIFAVKISFLLFFRQLLDRLDTLLKFWKATVGIVAVSAIYCISSIFISWPHFGTSPGQYPEKSAQAPNFTRTIIISGFANALDMLTDLLIVAVPVCLLWKVKIRLSQKIILGTFLCLSVCMFALSLVRIIGGTHGGHTGPILDFEWLTFWLVVEASVAVTVVSLTAFRSLYGIKTIQRQQKDKKRQQDLASYRRYLLSRRQQQRRVDEFGDPIPGEGSLLPSIPSATISGLRSAIGRMTAWSTQGLSTRGEQVTVEETQKEEVGSASTVGDSDSVHIIKSNVWHSTDRPSGPEKNHEVIYGMAV